MSQENPISSIPPRRRDWGALGAKMLCLLFALVGVLPLSLGFIAKTDAARAWASEETSRALRDSLGVDARYQLAISLLPLRLTLENLELDSTDGLGPALRARSASISPRVFSLIAGRVDIGDIEIEGAEHRLVIRDGQLVNLDLKLPAQTDDATLKRAPFTSVAITDAQFRLEIDGVQIVTGVVDIDVFAEPDGSFETAIRANNARVHYPPRFFVGRSGSGGDQDDGAADNPSEDVPTWDSDVLCSLDARLRIDPEGLLLRRLSLMGTIDTDPAQDTDPDCLVDAQAGDNPGRIAVRASQLRVDRTGGSGPYRVAGNVMLRAPLDAANRFGGTNLRGWLGLSGEVRYDGNSKLPDFSGNLQLGEMMLGRKRVLEGAQGQLTVDEDRVRLPEINVGYAGGKVTLTDVELSPFVTGMPLTTAKVEADDVNFSKLVRDVGVTPNTIVRWQLDKILVDNFGGTLDPPNLDGDLRANTSRFQLTDKAYHDPARKHLFGVNPAASIRTRFGVRPDSIQFNDSTVQFGNSSLRATVHVGFESWIRLDVPDASLDLSDISPLVAIPMQGLAELSAKMEGHAANPLLEGKIKVDNFIFGGFPIGDISQAAVQFRPMRVAITDGIVTKRGSRLSVPSAVLDFNGPHEVQADAVINSRNLDLQDFLHMWHFQKDPLWQTTTGQAELKTRVRFVLGGPRDACGAGDLRVDGHLKLAGLNLLDERYSSGNSDVDFRWRDPLAGYHGVRLNLPNIQLAKGTGTILGSFRIDEGARVKGDFVASSIPLRRLQSMGGLAQLVSADVSATATLGGTLDELEADVRATLGPALVGRTLLPPSRLGISLRPTPSRVKFKPLRSGCNRAVPEPKSADPEDFIAGVYHVNGQLFGDRVRFDGFTITRQRSKVARGGVIFDRLALGPLIELHPDIAGAKQRPSGELTGRADLGRWPLADPFGATASLSVNRLWIKHRGFRVQTKPFEGLRMGARKLHLPELSLSAATDAGQTTEFSLNGSVDRLGTKPQLDLEMALQPVQLSTWAAMLPTAEELQGVLQGKMSLRGPVDRLKHEGGFSLRQGRVAVRGMDLQWDKVDIDLALNNDKLTVKSASAELNGGRVRARGTAPLRGLSVGRYRGVIEARDVRLPTAQGMRATVDATLETTWQPPMGQTTAELPKITGEVSVKSFEYTRPVSMNADIVDLARRGTRTQFESYDPTKDVVELDMIVTSERPLRLVNNLIDARLNVEKTGLRLTGTNQRFGMRGRIMVVPGGLVRLRRNEFEIQSGEVRFDDPTQIAPRVDVTATTEYRRYSSGVGTAADVAALTGGATGAAASGEWRISMHAHGDADNLKLDLSSEPKLSQDDIFLLLTVGLTRAELDQAQSASVGESVALEALGSLTGADAAVTNAVPVIDEFKFGSAYSSRTGRTEPTVTIGKRLTERIRAFVTSGLSEAREVRSNLEWRLNRGVSVEGSYDNVNDISSSGLGNLGADVRWRLEFE